MERRPWFDAGHGGADPGAVGLGEEEDANLAITLRCIDAARRQGWATGATRTDDRFIPLADRCRMANNAKADAFVSVHADWSGAKGLGFQGIHRPSSASGLRLADAIVDELEPLTAYEDTGVYADRRGLAVLRGTNMPATIIEVMSVADAILFTEAFQTEVAERIIKGLCRLYGVAYIPPEGGEDVPNDCLWVLVPGTAANLGTAKKHADAMGLYAEKVTPGVLWIHVRLTRSAELLKRLSGYAAFAGRMKTMPTYVGSFKDLRGV